MDPYRPAKDNLKMKGFAGEIFGITKKDQWIRQLWQPKADSTPLGCVLKTADLIFKRNGDLGGVKHFNWSIFTSIEGHINDTYKYMYIYILYIIQFCSSHISCLCFLMRLYQKKRVQRASEQLGYSKCTTVWHDWISSCSGKGWNPATHCDCGDEFSGSKSTNGSPKQVGCWQLPVGLSKEAVRSNETLFKWSMVAFKRWGLAKLVLESEARSETINFHIFVCLQGACALPISLTIYFGIWKHMRPTLGIPKRVPFGPLRYQSLSDQWIW